MFNVSLAGGEIDFPLLGKVLNRCARERDGGEQSSKKYLTDESKLEQVNECIRVLSSFSRHAPHVNFELSTDFRYELLP